MDTAPPDPWAVSNDYAIRVAVAADIASGILEDEPEDVRPQVVPTTLA